MRTTCLICDRVAVQDRLCKEHFVAWNCSPEEERASRNAGAFFDFVTRLKLEELNGQPEDLALDVS